MTALIFLDFFFIRGFKGICITVNNKYRIEIVFVSLKNSYLILVKAVWPVGGGEMKRNRKSPGKGKPGGLAVVAGEPAVQTLSWQSDHGTCQERRVTTQHSQSGPDHDFS